eukprot:1158684-Pelagomonas_calceolata.AAC.3
MQKHTNERHEARIFLTGLEKHVEHFKAQCSCKGVACEGVACLVVNAGQALSMPGKAQAGSLWPIGSMWLIGSMRLIGSMHASTVANKALTCPTPCHRRTTLMPCLPFTSIHINNAIDAPRRCLACLCQASIAYDTIIITISHKLEHKWHLLVPYIPGGPQTYARGPKMMHAFAIRLPIVRLKDTLTAEWEYCVSWPGQRTSLIWLSRSPPEECTNKTAGPQSLDSVTSEPHTTEV